MIAQNFSEKTFDRIYIIKSKIPDSVLGTFMIYANDIYSYVI